MSGLGGSRTIAKLPVGKGSRRKRGPHVTESQGPPWSHAEPGGGLPGKTRGGGEKKKGVTEGR